MRGLITSFLLFTISSIVAQNPGDNTFGTDQILTVDLQFSQPGFWDSLVANYATETYMKADVTITDNTGTYNYHDIGIRLKGNSSYGHPGDKKSFKIDFNKYVDSLDYDKLEKLNFNNCFKDPTFMREKIMYDLSRTAGVHAPRCIYANVSMNNTFWGFYDVVEQVDDDFLNTHFDNSSENLFKAGAAFGTGAYYADLQYYGTDTIAYENRYSLDNNAAVNDWTDLMELTNFIDNSSDAEFADSLSAWFDVDDLMKSLVMDNLFSNLDSYTNSARNYYIYHNPAKGQWEWIKWDCNEAFGSYAGGGPGGAGGITGMTELAVDYYNLSRPLLERIVTISATRATYDYWYCVIKNAYFSNDYLDPIIDNLKTLISASVYADDNKMYSNADFDTNIENDITGGGGPGGGTIYGLKSFIAERNTYLDGVIDCSQVGTAIQTVAATKNSVYPNPAQDNIQIVLTSGSTSAVISLCDLNGRVLKQFKATGNLNTMDISQLAAGMYMIRIDENVTSSVIKFIKN